jgi:hypothetical protein
MDIEYSFISDMQRWFSSFGSVLPDGAQPVLRVEAKNGGSYDSTPLYAVFMVLILKFRDLFVSLCLCLLKVCLTD